MSLRLLGGRIISAMIVVIGISACVEKEPETDAAEKPLTVGEMVAQQQAELAPAIGSEQGRVDQFETYMATIHSFTSPEDSQLVNSHIIETDNTLVLIDGQFLRPYAQQLKDYIDSLEKPLERIYVSHQHPDHWFGLELFPDVPVYAQQPVADGIAARGEFYIENLRKEFGELVTETPQEVSNILQVHSDIFDGLTYEFELIEDAEVGAQTLIRLPEINVAFVQDMMSNNAHSFFASADLQPWIRNLAVFSVDAQESQIFVGHGYPARADAEQISHQISYLQTAKQILVDHHNTSADEMAAAMKSAYPDLGAVSLVDTSSWLYHNRLKPQIDAQVTE